MVKPTNGTSRAARDGHLDDARRSEVHPSVRQARREHDQPPPKPEVLVRLSNRGHKTVSLVDGGEFEVVPLVGHNWRRLLRRGTARLILVDALNLGAVAGWLVSVGLRYPFVVRVRGDFVTEQKEIAASEPPRARALRLAKLRVALWLFRRARAVIFNSRYSRGRLKAFAPRASQFVVENPVTISGEMAALAESATKGGGGGSGLRLLSLMNMNAYGKVMGLVRAIGWLGEEKLPEELGGRISWDIYGRGLFEPLISKAIAGAGLQDVVRLRGYTQKAAGELASCDIFAHFSNLDAFPNVTLEAMYFGKPILTNEGSCGTLEQVEHGRNGLVVDGREALVRALLSYSRDPDLRRSHGDAGREILREKFIPEVLRSKMGDALRAILVPKTATKGNGP